MAAGASSSRALEKTRHMLKILATTDVAPEKVSKIGSNSYGEHSRKAFCPDVSNYAELLVSATCARVRWSWLRVYVPGATQNVVYICIYYLWEMTNAVQYHSQGCMAVNSRDKVTVHLSEDVCLPHRATRFMYAYSTRAHTTQLAKHQQARLQCLEELKRLSQDRHNFAVFLQAGAPRVLLEMISRYVTNVSTAHVNMWP